MIANNILRRYPFEFFARVRPCLRVGVMTMFCAWLVGCATTPPTCDTLCQDSQRRTAYLEQHTDLTSRMRAAISEGRIIIGMTPAHVRAALGEPSQIIAGRPDIVAREQWLYRAPDNSANWVYFQMGEVRSWTGDNTDN